MSSSKKPLEATNDEKVISISDEQENASDELSEPVYTIRALQARDIFAFAQVINKIGFKEFKKVFESDDIRDAIAQAKNDDGTINLDSVGLQVAMDIASLIIEHLPDAEQEIYALLSSLSNIPVANISTMGMIDFLSMVVDVVKRPEFGDFIKVASKLRK